MSNTPWLVPMLFIGMLLVLAFPVGRLLGGVEGEARGLLRVLIPIERGLLRLAGTVALEPMDARAYSRALLGFQLASVVLLYLMLRLQAWLPWNPLGLAGMAPDLAFNTAVSFTTNTNWQSYGGETSLTPLTQMLGLGVQNFASAATGLAVLLVLARGFTRRETHDVGNFWQDLVRITVRTLLPLSFVLAVALVTQGVTQSVEVELRANWLDPSSASAQVLPEQSIAIGPVASQVAIKQLGTNGGGYFNANSAHPIENPTPLSNLLQSLALLLVPAASCIAFGSWVRDRRQGWVLLASMLVLFVPVLWLCVNAETSGTPTLRAANIETAASPAQPGGNMEGKEVRNGVVASALWAVATTASSNGSVNAMHDSFTPLGGLAPMWLMLLGEVAFGGVGSGLYGMLLFALVAVFVAGLMVGRTPEYLGKKLGVFEMRMAGLAILAPCLCVLIGAAAACATSAGRAGIQDGGPHGFSEVLYAFASASNNNGSAFAGLTAATPFYDGLLGLAMLSGRYLVMLPVIAIAGSLAAKKSLPKNAGTLPTHGPLFLCLLVATVVLVGALSFLPALALGPIAEHLRGGFGS